MATTRRWRRQWRQCRGNGAGRRAGCRRPPRSRTGGANGGGCEEPTAVAVANSPRSGERLW